MKLLTSCAVLLAVAAFCTPSMAVANARVTARGGNVFITRSGKTTQITKYGSNSEPQLSPDGHWIVYIHTLAGKRLETGVGTVPANEIWISATDGSHRRRLVTCQDNADLKKLLAGLQSPQFSPDGRFVYFLSNVWATSDAVHAVDVATGRDRFICDGNSLHVVMRGEHSGCLIVSQHKYFAEAGSYDWYWLLDKKGKVIGPLGDRDRLFSESD